MIVKQKTINLELFADYRQFYLQDDEPYGETIKGDLEDAWTIEATRRLLATKRFVVGVGTVRNMDVPVIIHTSETKPNIEFDKYDLINRCCLEIETGRILIAGCIDYYPDALRIDVPNGLYELLIGYGNLDELSEDGLEGDDFYEIFIFPTERFVETETLKYWAGSKDWN